MSAGEESDPNRWYSSSHASHLVVFFDSPLLLLMAPRSSSLLSWEACLSITECLMTLFSSLSHVSEAYT